MIVVIVCRWRRCVIVVIVCRWWLCVIVVSQDLDVYNVDDEKMCVTAKPAHTDEKPFHCKVRQLLDNASDQSRLAVMPSHWQPWL